MSESFNIVLNRYKKCKVISESIYKYIKKEMKKLKSVMEVRIKGEEYTKECIKLTDGEYKMWSPITISKNNWINMWNDEGVEIEEGDVIKIEFAITDTSVIYYFGETFVYKCGEETSGCEEIINKLKNIPKNLCKNVYGEEVDDGEIELINDTIRQYIESECTKFDCYPVENVTSYRDANEMVCKKLERNDCMEVNTNQIILGYKRKLSKDQEWILVDNPCCMIEEGDVYNLEISIIKDKRKSGLLKENEHEYIEHESGLYRLDFKEKTMLKTASGRNFYNRVKKEYGDGIFRKNKTVESIRDKLGFRECKNANLFTEYKTKSVKDGGIVYTLRCVIYYKNGRLNLMT